ncbi:MAG: hypothetical protein J7K04_10050 [Spirochaetales bacterium]|nr:hypothetical protein [Spirochaetales bacterium]
MDKKKDFYLFPPVLVGINFSVMLLIGILFQKTSLKILDFISMAIGVIFSVIFVVSLVSTHKIKQSQMKPDDVDKFIIDGPYSI